MKFKFFRSRLFKTNLVFKLHQPVSFLKIEIIFVSTSVVPNRGAAAH